MDLKNLDCSKLAETGITFELEHPGGHDWGLPNDKVPTLTVAGRDSETYRAAEKIEKNKMNSMTQKQRAKIDIDQLRRQTINILVKCVLGWTNLEEDGKELVCNHSNKERILRSPGYEWIVDQAEQKINDRSELFLDK